MGLGGQDFRGPDLRRCWPSLTTLTTNLDQLECRPTVERGRVIRWGLAAVGVACVGLGALGVVLPGLPTTIFLIIATWCFAKSCPFLEQRLIRNRFFAPFLRYVDRAEPIPAKAKVAAIATMWVFVALSCALFVLRVEIPAWPAIPVAIAAVIGTVAIIRWDAGVRRKLAAG